MIDNPVSWFILVILTVAAICVFLQKIDAEISQNHMENDDFFWKMEWEKRNKHRRF